MSAPVKLFMDDLPDNWSTRFGSYHVTREAVIDFAAKFDPQDFHLDDDAAARGPFGRLTASGWHSSAIYMRLLVDELHRLNMPALGSPGVEAINFLKPVCPGDTLTAELSLLERRVSNSRPDRWIVKMRSALRNQDDDVVWTSRSIAFFPRKPEQAG